MSRRDAQPARTNATRALDALGVPYETLSFSPEVVVSAGTRGLNLRLAVGDLVQATQALVADVAAPLRGERASTD